MSHKQRNPWQRMALSVFGCAILAFNWRVAVAHLYSLPEHSIASFTSITNNVAYTISLIVVFMVTGKLVSELKNTSSTVTEIKSAYERRVEPKQVDDGTVQ